MPPAPDSVIDNDPLTEEPDERTLSCLAREWRKVGDRPAYHDLAAALVWRARRLVRPLEDFSKIEESDHNWGQQEKPTRQQPPEFELGWRLTGPLLLNQKAVHTGGVPVVRRRIPKRRRFPHAHIHRLQ